VERKEGIFCGKKVEKKRIFHEWNKELERNFLKKIRKVLKGIKMYEHDRNEFKMNSNLDYFSFFCLRLTCLVFFFVRPPACVMLMKRSPLE